MLDTSRFDLIRLLSHQPLFNGIDRDRLLLLAQASHLHRRVRGEIVRRQGEPCDALQVVLTGQVKLFVVSRSSQEKVVEIVGPGQSFGESFLFQRQECMWSSQVLSDALLVSVQRQAVIDEVQRNGTFAMLMLARLSRRLHHAVDDLQSQSLCSGVQRVVGYLLREAGEPAQRPKGHTVTLPGTKATIASLLSITPEYFSRVLSDLEHAGLIKVDRRAITIVDAERLADCHG